MAPLDLDPGMQARGLDAVRRLLALRSEAPREPLWRPLLAATLTAVAALGLCATILAQGPTPGDPSSGPPGVRAPLPGR